MMSQTDGYFGRLERISTSLLQERVAEFLMAALDGGSA